MSKYYSGDELLSRHYNLNFICGDRFGGKSTFAQKYILKRAIEYYKHPSSDKYKQEFAVLVRYDKDINTLCNTYFNNTMDIFYKDYELKFEKKKFWLHKKNSSDNWLMVGYGFALNQATKMKSTSYPYITTMVMEEFMNLEGKYIKSASNPELEVELLISLYSTIARGNGKQVRDNLRVLCISNNFYLNNPYFRYFNIIDKISANPFKRFYEFKTDPKCLVEITHNDVHISMGRDDINKGNKFIDMQHQLKLLQSFNVKKLLFQLTFDNKTILSVCRINDSIGVFESENWRDGCMHISCSEIKSKNYIDIAFFKKLEHYKQLLNLFNMNEIYYDKLQSYITLFNILHFSPQG